MEFEVKNDKKKKIIIIIAIVVGVILITAGCIFYFNSKTGNKPNLGEDVPIGDVNAEVVESTDQGRNLQNEIQELNKSYSDAIGWLKVPGTVIDTAIFQSKDNDRYLRNDRDNNNTMWGETFLDYRCDINKMDKATHFIIYGHNTETDDHFTPLLNYKKKEFFDAHQIIEFSTLKGNFKWQVFSAYVTDTDFFYIDTNFETVDEFKEFVSTLKSKSLYDTNQSVSEEDTILTLSTCDYSRTNGRFVVQCKLINN